MKNGLRNAARGAAFAGAVAAFQIAGTTGAAAIEAHNKAEFAALQVRMLQTEMMVAALTCNYHLEYNTFIETHGSELTRHASTLKAMFRRQHGGSAQRALDRYVTQLANDVSIRSIRTRATFCETAMGLFRSADQGAALADLGAGTMVQAAAAPTDGAAAK